MSAKKPNELIDRYEEMLRGTVSCYFDTDEIDEISDYYESKGQLSKALHAIEFGLNLHPDNVDLKLKEARYMLYLDRADEAKRIMSELADYSLDATLIRAELLFIDGYMSDGHALLLAMSVSYTHLRAHETGRNLVCRLLLEKKKKGRKRNRMIIKGILLNIKTT